ncbi:zinc-binding dehydrogenase [Fructilactobacillus hinvesii]|uniref:Zinc-binding dehydrogenase n=1 Tax=Fructilactobacillus hinvesii TaxID=2940300 RepID=A0ABY5BTQ3_9LACO|nr:zinc-binding dehydrogenase [Fructilactobacillus hinvesii]USS88510.1 zinc-binding dehydrogenase [Fructilactobacillus hinvesii]
MKAIIQTNYQGINGLKIQNVKVPNINPLSTLIKVKYVPVLPYDVKSESGNLSNVHPQSLPRVIGYSAAGIIEKTGTLRNKQLMGKRVIAFAKDGSFSEYVTANIPPYTFIIPDNVSFEAAATVFGGADTALMALQTLKIRSTDKVLIVGGSGGIGTYLVQMLNNLNVSTTILSSSESEKFLKQNFQNQVYTGSDMIPSENFDYLIDTTGNTRLLNDLENKLKHDGTIFPLSLPFYQSLHENINVVFHNRPLMPHYYTEILQMISKGKLIPFIDSIYAFDDIKDAQRKLDGHGKKGRILLKVND